MPPHCRGSDVLLNWCSSSSCTSSLSSPSLFLCHFPSLMSYIFLFFSTSFLLRFLRGEKWHVHFHVMAFLFAALPACLPAWHPLCDPRLHDLNGSLIICPPSPSLSLSLYIYIYIHLSNTHCLLHSSWITHSLTGLVRRGERQTEGEIEEERGSSGLLKACCCCCSFA